MNSIVPFAMLDGHGSGLESSFLQYINAPVIEWCVCLGVVYGTVFW